MGYNSEVENRTLQNKTALKRQLLFKGAGNSTLPLSTLHSYVPTIQRTVLELH
jgi:hypothetical protein